MIYDFCDSCHYKFEIQELKSIFINVRNYIICQNCINKLVREDKIIYEKKEIEEHYRPTEKFSELGWFCQHCKKYFRNHLVFILHQRYLE